MKISTLAAKRMRPEFGDCTVCGAVLLKKLPALKNI
jgi:hypothetical protein